MSSNNSHKRRIQPLDQQDNQHSNPKWKDAICSICLELPHNCVLLNCSSYDKGCRPFICDTNHNHSNCLDRFKAAHKLPMTSSEVSLSSYSDSSPTCPLCRGAVTGWVIIDEARHYFNSKKRSCDERECSFIGNYTELQSHAKENHPNAHPAEVDPARRLDWENFQQSSEIIDVLSTIHSEVPNSLVFGDYVIEYGDESGDEYEDFPGDEGNWWTSCILYQVFDNFRALRSRQSRAIEFRRSQQRSVYDTTNRVDISISPPDLGEYRFDDSDDDFVSTRVSDDGGSSSSSSGYRSYRRRRSQLQDP